jgi:hypothetical protein
MKKGITTEQLAEEAIKSVQSMSEEEKAKLRQHLEAAKQATGDSVLDWMIAHKRPLTLREYVQINWMGEKSVDDLDGETLAEIESLLEENQLVDSPSNFRN